MKLTVDVKTNIKKLVAPVAKIQRTLQYYANEVRNEAVDNINAQNIIDTGNLLNSVQVDVNMTKLQAEIGTRVHYAIYQEQGTRYIRARPFFQPAYEKVKPEFIKAIEKIL